MQMIPPHLHALIHRVQAASIMYKTRLSERIIKLSAAFAEDLQRISGISNLSVVVGPVITRR